jgi:MoxR-like ATPase
MLAQQDTLPDSDLEKAKQIQSTFETVKSELSRVIVGLDEEIEQIFIALLCKGHCILEGAPGLAKTKLISSLASLLDLSFRRVQFTPDLMPGDLTGSEVLQQDMETGERFFRFQQGPLFGNLVLADEVNRTPPKTQSALLEAMEERQITVGQTTYPLPRPFFVLATQNPIEHEGTYPLPEAQLDRFMLKILLNYPDKANESEIIRKASGEEPVELKPVITGEQLEEMQQLVRRVPIADSCIDYAADVVRRSRPGTAEILPELSGSLAWGAGPRAGIFLASTAKARAILEGRQHATTDDIKAMAAPVMRHRLAITFNAESEGITADDLIGKLL